jgi:hypothetical protein
LTPRGRHNGLCVHISHCQMGWRHTHRRIRALPDHKHRHARACQVSDEVAHQLGYYLFFVCPQWCKTLVLSTIYVLLRPLAPHCFISHGQLFMDKKSYRCHTPPFRSIARLFTSSPTINIAQTHTAAGSWRSEDRISALRYARNGQVLFRRKGARYFECCPVPVCTVIYQAE